MAAADFLVEIGVEELPPQSLPALERHFRNAFLEGLDSAGLPCEALQTYASPRRLALLARSMAARQRTQVIERRGPPLAAARDANGAWTRAATAFAKSCGSAPETLHALRTPKGEWLAFRERRRGRSAASLLPGIVADALRRLPIGRAMRWGAGDEEFVRPVHWVVMLRGRTVVPATILGQRSGRISRGHRFMGEKRLRLDSAGDYAEALRERGRVIANFRDRRETIMNLARKQAAGLGGELVSSPELEDEIAGLVEWPVALAGAFEKRFLRLPEAVIVATLQEHLRFFPVRGPCGKLLAGFVLISNLESSRAGSVSEGAERVVRARLNDADFFYRRDGGETLADRLPALKAVRYQERLGSLGERTDRLAALAEEMAAATGADPAAARRAALLCKADLLTGMVGEFPSLQGVIGEHYARRDGEAEALCVAIGEHYDPRQAGEAIPASPAGRAVALADRLDSLAGLFAAGRRPKGASDPFGLRRAALSMLRICIEGSVELDLANALGRALRLQPMENQNKQDAAQAAYAFIMERLKAWYLDGLHPDCGDFNVTPELFAAVRARNPVSPLDFHRRLKALHGFLARAAANDLAAANKRIGNILRSADASTGEVQEGFLIEAQEQALHTAFLRLLPQYRQRLEAQDYAAALSLLASLAKPLNDFFDHVLVMSEDDKLRRNRLALLDGIREAMLAVADLSLLPGRT
ncbi:MAG: glycine--tRNA ligase subunit beta [Gammaproteobacteria bacterium]|nr:glycine--tRNA ligase subunit beta [Gammaproteobacteria bacterium]